MEPNKNSAEVEYVDFQGGRVPKSYRDSYMAGYNDPWGIAPEGEDAAAYHKGQIAQRQDTCMAGTF